MYIKSRNTFSARSSAAIPHPTTQYRLIMTLPMAGTNNPVSNNESAVPRQLHQMRSCPSHPTRIILRLYVKDFEGNGFSWFDHTTAIETYLKWADRSLDDWKQKKHNVFVEHFQDPEVNQRSFHVLIDLYSLSFHVEDMDTVQHEIYRIRRLGDGTLYVFVIPICLDSQTDRSEPSKK